MKGTKTDVRVHAFLSSSHVPAMLAEDGRMAVAWGVQLAYYYGPKNGPRDEEWRHGPAASGIVFSGSLRAGLWHAFRMASHMAAADGISSMNREKPSLMVVHGFDDRFAESIARAAKANGDWSGNPSADCFHTGIRACVYSDALGWPYEADPEDLMCIARDAVEMAVEKSRETEDD